MSIGVCVGSTMLCIGSVMLCVGFTRLFEYQHVDIGNEKNLVLGVLPYGKSYCTVFHVLVQYRLKKQDDDGNDMLQDRNRILWQLDV